MGHQDKNTNVLSDSNFLILGCEEFMTGRAGYVLGSMFLSQRFPDLKGHLPSNIQLYDILDAMLKVGRVSFGASRTDPPLMYEWHETKYFGAAHGLSSILLAFLSVPGYLNDRCSERNRADIKRSVEYVLGLQTATGNFPSSARWLTKVRPEEDELVHWCHGASGVVYLMAKGIFAQSFFSKNNLRV